MRPVKLTISAFGPYSAVETIDFRKLGNKNIFLITGATGAGKTTIFDAISFALFGEASGSSRDKDSLRSDFAPIDIPTFVELEFELKGENYVVTRYPQQERKKTKGEGTVFKTSEACLKTPDGEIITRISIVDEKISSIIGINKNQFRQIVMLPQGEFRKLLEAESKERELIFRKIFGTEAFQIIQQRLDMLQKEQYKKIKDGETKRSVHIKNIASDGDQLLAALVNADYLNITEITTRTRELIKREEEEEKQYNAELEKVTKEKIILQKEIVKAEEINSRLKEKTDSYNAYIVLKNEEEKYKKENERLIKARKALQVKLVEDSLKDRRKNLKDRLKELEIYGNKLLSIEQKLISAQTILKKEEVKQEEKIILLEELAKLKDKEYKVNSYETKTKEIVELKVMVSQEKAALEGLKQAIGKHKDKLNKAKEIILNIKSCETEKAETLKLCGEKQTMVERLRELRDKINQYSSNLREHEIQAKEYEKFEKEFLSFKHSYEALQDNFLKAQAGILARSLKEGMKCPVCGSITHPSPAILLWDVPSEEQLKLSKSIYEEKQEEKNKILRNLASLKGRVDESLQQLEYIKEQNASVFETSIMLLTNEEIKKLINGKGPQLKSELDRLNIRISQLQTIISSKEETESFIIKLEAELKDREERLPEVEEQYKSLYSRLVSEEDTLKNLENELPNEIRTSDKLKEKINDLQGTVAIIEKLYREAQTHYNDTKNLLSSCKAEVQEKKNNIFQTEDEVNKWQALLNNKLLECGFSNYEEYSCTRISEEEIENINENINMFYQKLQSALDRSKKSELSCEGLQEADVNALKDGIEKLEQNEKQLLEIQKLIYAKLTNNSKVLKDIEKINSEISTDEEEYSVISDISKAANGFNEERITFERYVLAAYFDEIINAANIRLTKMTGGRFVLKRKEEKGKGTKQEGLELEVFDNYTGKSRHVKTLSGGESFKASLALALGLADIVQAYAGGISLDTIFVDEGFGTLDPESLDNAIECLIDLQKGGRLVGIISHVPELKERIDTRLEITPAKEGSRARFIM